jgi:predicted XRE-type DNA-binding protein
MKPLHWIGSAKKDLVGMPEEVHSSVKRNHEFVMEPDMNTNDTQIKTGSGNVCADLGMADAQEMLVKAKLASKISDIIKRQGLTQQQAAELLAMPQPKVSLMLRGQFRGISESKMLDCLARLGRDIDIVVKPARRRTKTDAHASPGIVNVVFA